MPKLSEHQWNKVNCVSCNWQMKWMNLILWKWWKGKIDFFESLLIIFIQFIKFGEKKQNEMKCSVYISTEQTHFASIFENKSIKIIYCNCCVFHVDWRNRCISNIRLYLLIHHVHEWNCVWFFVVWIKYHVALVQHRSHDNVDLYIKEEEEENDERNTFDWNHFHYRLDCESDYWWEVSNLLNGMFTWSRKKFLTFSNKASVFEMFSFAW